MNNIKVTVELIVRNNQKEEMAFIKEVFLKNKAIVPDKGDSFEVIPGVVTKVSDRVWDTNSIFMNLSLILDQVVLFTDKQKLGFSPEIQTMLHKGWNVVREE